jgi:hypothetical protein
VLIYVEEWIHWERRSVPLTTGDAANSWEDECILQILMAMIPVIQDVDVEYALIGHCWYSSHAHK